MTGPIGNRRGVVVAAVTTLHLLLASVLMVAPHGMPSPVAAPAMVLLAIPAPRAEAPIVEPPPEVVPPAVVAAAMPVEPDPPQVIVAAMPSLAGGPPGPCAPAAALQSALASAPEVRTALAAVPTRQRSVADAIVIWNSGWAALASNDRAPLASVRAVVTQTLRAMPAACLAEAVDGPRLVLIDAGAGTIVLAFGSGKWRWQDLAVVA